MTDKSELQRLREFTRDVLAIPPKDTRTAEDHERERKLKEREAKRKAER